MGRGQREPGKWRQVERERETDTVRERERQGGRERETQGERRGRNSLFVNARLCGWLVSSIVKLCSGNDLARRVSCEHKVRKQETNYAWRVQYVTATIPYIPSYLSIIPCGSLGTCFRILMNSLGVTTQFKDSLLRQLEA